MAILKSKVSDIEEGSVFLKHSVVNIVSGPNDAGSWTLDSQVSAANDACTHLVCWWRSCLRSAGFVPLRPVCMPRLLSTWPSHYGRRPITTESRTVPSRQSRQQSGAVRVAQIVGHSSSVFDSSVTRSTTRRSSRDFNCLMRGRASVGRRPSTDRGRSAGSAPLSTVTAAVNSTAPAK